MKKFFLWLAFSLSWLSAGETADLLALKQRVECPLFRCSTGEWSHADSRIALLEEGDALVLEAVCRKPEGTSFSGQETRPDAPGIFAGDVFELLVSPREGCYYHLALSPAGGFYTAKKRDTSWGEKEGVTAENQLSGDHWKIRFRLPYSALGEERPRPGTVWKICIGQVLPAEYGLHESSSLSGAEDYHNTGEYARLIFGREADPSPRLIRLVVQPDGCRFDFVLPAGWREGVKAGWNEERDAAGVQLKREGENLSCFLPYPGRKIPLKTVLPVTLQLGEKRFSGQLRIGDPAAVEIDRFYLMPGEREISISHTLPGKLSLTLTDEAGKTVFSREAAGGREKILLPEKTLPGIYRISLSGVFGTLCREVVLLPGTVPVRPGPLSLREGKLYRDGKPVFFVGTSPTGKTFLPVPAFSLDLGKQGIKKNAARLLMLPSVPYLRKPQPGREYPALPEYLKGVTAWLEKKDPEEEAMVRLAYEANLPLRENGAAVSPADFMKRFFGALKQRAGKRLLTLQCDDRSQIAALSPSCDIFECAFYSSSYAPWMMPRLNQDMKFLKENVFQGRPVFFWLGGTVPNKNCRIAEEIRCASLLAMIHGFQGVIIHLGHGSLPRERLRLWSLLTHLDDEMQRFYAQISDGEDVTENYLLPPPFVVKAVKKKEGTLLLIVNSSGTVQNSSYGEFAPYGVKTVLQRR